MKAYLGKYLLAEKRSNETENEFKTCVYLDAFNCTPPPGDYHFNLIQFTYPWDDVPRHIRIFLNMLIRNSQDFRDFYDRNEKISAINMLREYYPMLSSMESKGYIDAFFEKG